MHGYYATADLLAIALEQAQLDQDEQITCLNINLSLDAHCAPDLIRYYFKKLAANTAAAGAQLIFAMAPAAEPVQLLEIDITMLDEPEADLDDCCVRRGLPDPE